ncbi:MAG: methionyl-tRNA formyltransferase [Gammaproteobacteria bacterium]|nr:methionyl-tRNA formyltransferase [Gammaproteobacteria bacterium]MCW8987094.1 methionyl-tRNA formyltransferase [Gammaproteobacteria bacterium]MCW9031456.1 methionyl-tRNA formyltransferase [Gammaproteobacteria bacterium]
MASLRIIFAGTPDFAASSLTALLNTEHKIVAVYTQPDRPAGRGRKLRASPVKDVALKNDIPVFQPENLKDSEAQDVLRSFDADVMVVAAYGLILPQAVLDIPRLGCLNIHASLLPRWRGAAPIQRAIAAGDTESGITIMQMNAGLDTGDILQLFSCPITEKDTGGDLHDRLAEIGATAILETLNNLESGKLKPVAQDDALATYAHKLDKKEAQINWQNSAIEIERLIRAFNPWPVAYTQFEDKTLRIWQAQVLTLDSNIKANSKPGTVISCDKKGIDVSCGEGTLRILNLQPSGSKAMDVAAFMNGHAKQLPAGSLLQNPSST